MTATRARRLEAYLDEHARRTAGRPTSKLPADPEHLGPAASTPTTAARRPSGSRPSCARAASSTSRSPTTGGHPIVYADWLHAAGRADGARLRPLRRPAGRPARPVGPPPFEPVVKDGRISRRGAADDKGQLHIHLRARRGAAGHPRPAAGQRPVRVRGRGGVRLGAPRRAGSRPTASGWRPTSRSSATRASSRATCRRSRSACAGSCTPRSTSPGRRLDLHSGGYGGDGREPGQRPGPDHHRR